MGNSPVNIVALRKYDAACHAIAALRTTDDAIKIRNEAIAVKAYAKQAKNTQLEKDAIAIRMRAERRLGEILEAQRKTVGLNKGGAERGIGRRGKKNAGYEKTRIVNPPTFADAGIDKNLADRARKAAKYTPAQFEKRVESIRATAPSVHHSSETPEHYTPDSILEIVRSCLGEIDLDPCSNGGVAPNVPASRHLTRAVDGLALEWNGRVYMNPPYGREIDAWIAKLIEEFQAGRVTEAIALVPARTDTEWFSRLRDHVCCFIRGRLTFKGNNDPAPFPSALFYLGPDLSKFFAHVNQIGDVWQRLEPGMFGE